MYHDASMERDRNAPLAVALAAYREGRAADAYRVAADFWSASGDARAAGLLALLEMEAGRLDSARTWNDRARAADPHDARYEIQHARLALAGGDCAEAFERFAARARAAPHTKGVWSGLTAAARACDRRAEARRLCLAACETDPLLAPALRALLELVADEPPGPARVTPVAVADRRAISVVTCSVDDRRFAAMSASYDRALADWPHEIVRIPDAQSIAEGYTRGAAAARGELLVFTHDDVEILAPDFGHRLARRLAECDVLGVAGATRATGPAWPFAGWPHLHGSVIYPDGEGYRVTVYSLRAPIARGIVVMDGVFLAARRGTALAVGWDAETCDGFHGYDVDFTLRAARAGLRLVVASDLGVVHRSYGSFDDRWQATAIKLAAKHPELNGVRDKETGFVPCGVADATRAMALVDNWARLGERT